MDTKTMNQWVHNFTRIYPEPCSQEEIEAYVVVWNAVTWAKEVQRCGWLAWPHYNYYVKPPEQKAWLTWKDECFSRAEKLYELAPIAFMKHVDAGGIGEEFYEEN